METTKRLGLTIGPLQYWWPRTSMLQAYAELAEGPADTFVLGEVTCSRRNEFTLLDWLALARDLVSAGKRVRLATLPLLMSEAELRQLRRIAEQGEFAVEAGDAAALQRLAQVPETSSEASPERLPFTLGPHLNIYSRVALVEHAGLGADTWVAPLELALDAVARINPPEARVQGQRGAIQTEVFGFGRMPLAFSARCFTARHHRLSKDECEFRCRDDADGLLLSTTEGQPFLVLNGISTQSAALHCLIGEGAALRAAGVDRLRLSPCSQGFARVVELFDAVLHAGLPLAEAHAELQALPLPGALVNGFAHRQAGMVQEDLAHV
ncbi:U32 family peptidase [Paucibacter soli]|uniref:U32 family peptidase n=1 Tax=Paucibacter soli TaxID=3133433 RepID=UPI0030AD903B